MEITLPNSQGNQSFRSVAGKRSSGRAVYLGDLRLALLGRSPVGAEKSALTTPCPIAASSVFSGKVQNGLKAGRKDDALSGLAASTYGDVCDARRERETPYAKSRKHRVSSRLSGHCLFCRVDGWVRRIWPRDSPERREAGGLSLLTCHFNRRAIFPASLRDFMRSQVEIAKNRSFDHDHHPFFLLGGY